MNQDYLGLNMSPKRERVFRDVRNMILDYALGAALIGLIPIDGFLILKFLIAAVLNIKMMWDVGRRWNFPKGQDILAQAGNLFAALGAVALGLVTWITVFAIGLFVPYVSSFAIAASLFTVTWMIGQATHQFYANGHQ
jgi:uncharacterized protein (DUF697 family)